MQKKEKIKKEKLSPCVSSVLVVMHLLLLHGWRWHPAAGASSAIVGEAVHVGHNAVLTSVV